MSDPAIDLSGRYTYGDYQRWPEEERWELINGVAYDMCAAPLLRHQSLCLYLGSKLHEFPGRENMHGFNRAR